MLKKKPEKFDSIRFVILIVGLFRGCICDIQHKTSWKKKNQRSRLYTIVFERKNTRHTSVSHSFLSIGQHSSFGFGRVTLLRYILFNTRSINKQNLLYTKIDKEKYRMILSIRTKRPFIYSVMQQTLTKRA